MDTIARWVFTPHIGTHPELLPFYVASAIKVRLNSHRITHFRIDQSIKQIYTHVLNLV